MRKFVQPIKNWDIEIFEEMQDMADGSKLQLEDIVAISARYELAISRMGVTKAGEGCTAIAS